MIDVKEIFKVNKNITVLICDMFSDEDVTKTIKSNVGEHKSFEVEAVQACFSVPKTRSIVMMGTGDFSKIKSIEFI